MTTVPSVPRVSTYSVSVADVAVKEIVESIAERVPPVWSRLSARSTAEVEKSRLPPVSFRSSPIARSNPSVSNVPAACSKSSAVEKVLAWVIVPV